MATARGISGSVHMLRRVRLHMLKSSGLLNDDDLNLGKGLHLSKGKDDIFKS
jgi:hypothetical protein